jgi:hypothetical protein
VRWINIPGSQGSTTDIRDIKKMHTYQGSVQTGTGTTPVQLQWATLPLSPSFTMRLRIPALSVDLDMHSVSSYDLVDEGKYIFYVDVKEPDCPPPTEEPEVDITIERIKPNDFPCVELELLVRDRQSHAALPYYNPFRLSFYERSTAGVYTPAEVSQIVQLDSTFLLRLCTDPENKDPEREIVIIPDDNKPEIKPDTTGIKIPTPIPDPDEDQYQFVRRNSGDWEMVSLPVKMEASLIASLYPDPSTKLYLFNTATGMYEGASDMTFGTGYWLKTNTRSTLFLGNEVTSNRLTGLSGIGQPPAYGWNMIGGITHPVAVASIVQNPAGAMKAIFGWNSSSGYVVPTSVDPGEGYWVRTDPGTTLTLSGTSIRGSGGTAYEKTADGIGVAAVLSVRQGTAAGQRITLATHDLSSEDLNVLSLPALPPGDLFDARVDNGTLFMQPGENVLSIQFDGEIQLALAPSENSLREVQLLDENGMLLYTFRTDQSSIFGVEVHGSRNFLLRYQTKDAAPLRFALEQNYPNPMRVGEQTTMRFSLDRDGPVRLVVFDLLGRPMRELVDDTRRAGHYSAQWDGRDNKGGLLPSGLYMYRLEAGGQVHTRRCTIVR